MMLLVGQVALLFVTTSVVVTTADDDNTGTLEDVANGWGEDYAWTPDLATALDQAQQQWKPVMLIIHKSWCGACKKLKEVFSQDDELVELSQNFIMINLGDDKEPQDDKFKPDGSYIPRIFFLHPDGSLLSEVINKDGNPKFKYYYYSTDSILDSMDEVMELSESWERSSKDEL